MSRITHICSIVFFGTLVSGCGGGGGGGSSSAPGGVSSTAQPPLAISAANSEVTAGEVAGAGDTAVGAGSSGAAIITGVAVQTSARPGLAQVARFALETVGGLRGQLLPVVSGVVISATEPCSSGGNISVTWNDADNNGVESTGDTFDLVFNSCIEFGVTLNGSVSLTALTLVGDPMVAAPWNMAATLTFSGFRLSAGGETLRVNGGMAFAATTPDGVNVDTTITGSTLSMVESGFTSTLRNFNFAYAENLSTTAFSLSYSATLDIGRLSGRVTFATTTAFSGNDILGSWPTVGAMRITGASNSSILLTAMGGDNVRLEIDTNGDTAIDQTINTTWTAIAAL